MTVTNYSTVLFLVNKQVRAIKCAYELNAKGEPCGNLTIFKTFDPSIKVGDDVVVPTTTRVNKTVVRVAEADVEVDLESAVQVDWIIGAVDSAAFQVVLGKEQEAISKIKAAELRKKRDELAATLLANIDAEGAESLKLIDMSATPAIASVAPVNVETVTQ